MAKWNQILDPLYLFSSSLPILRLNASSSLVQPSSRLTIHLYAKRSAHPDILIGAHEMPIPQASQSGSFCCELPFLFNPFNISRADIPCVLGNVAGGAARSTQPVTLYISVNITPPNLRNSIPTGDEASPGEEATNSERNQIPIPEHLLPSSHRPVETGNTMLQSREEMSPTSTNNPRFALRWADKVMERNVPIDRSNTWGNAVRRIKWVMDALSPVTEVRIIPLMSLAELTFRFSFSHSQRWRTVYFQQSPRHVHFCCFPDELLIHYSPGLQTLLEQYERDDNVHSLLQAVHDAFDFAHHEETLKSIKPQTEQAQILILMLQDVCSCCDFIQSYAKDSQFCTSTCSASLLL